MRRRNARVGGAASASPPSDKVDPEACYQRAKVEMGQERHAKAVELMRQACEADAENAFYSAYLLWAQFREEGGMDADSEYATELRGMLRGMLAAGEHNDFANHALGHIAYAAQDWQRAEKFFKKSLDANKRNRDAERYLRIVERRKKQKSSDEPQKIFGIEISGRVGKKD